MNEKYPKTLNRKLRTSWGRWISIFLLLCLFQADAQAYISYAHYAIQKSRIEKSEAVANTSTSTKVSSDAGCKVACSHGMPSWESLSGNFSAVTGGSHSHIPISVQVDTTKTVGEIPYQSGTTPTGGVTYTVPVEVAPGRGNMQPELSITYNSQGGNGALGYGWSIGGLSAINKVAKNYYYNGTSAPVSFTTDDALMLDGMRLLPTGVSNQFESERGNMRITGNVYNSDYRSFTVEYPNGMVGTYGFTTGTAKQLAFPLTRLQDALGNYMDFSYDQVEGQYYISKISYGAHTTSASHLAEVVFTYVSRPDVVLVYEAGKEIKFSHLLAKIECKNGGDVLHTYTFTYDADSDVSLLQNLGCDNLNPLRFYYGYADNTETELQYSNNTLFPHFNSTVGIIASKFKLQSGEEDDGLIVYPDKSPFFQYNNDRYECGYATNQSLIVYGHVTDFSTPLPMEFTAGEGFQCMIAGDVDGKSGDELLKINNTVVNGKDRLTVGVYKYNVVTNFGLANTFIYDSTPAKSGSFWPKRYLLGDFNGDGTVELLAISLDKPLSRSDLRSRVFLFNPSTNTTYYNASTPLYLTASDRLVPMDVNGDGKTEICHFNYDGMSVYSFQVSSTGTYTFVKLFTDTTINARYLSNRMLTFGDVNGDGKCDIVVSPKRSYEEVTTETIPVYTQTECTECPLQYVSGICPLCGTNVEPASVCIECETPLNKNKECPYHGKEVTKTVRRFYDYGNYWDVYYSTGTGLSKTSRFNTKHMAGMKCLLQDVNQDGYADLVNVHDKNIHVYYSWEGRLGSFPVSQYIPSLSTNVTLVPSNVFKPDYYNFLLLIQGETFFKVNSTKNEFKQRFLTGMTNSLGVTQHNYYQRLNDDSQNEGLGNFYENNNVTPTVPYDNFYGPLWAVSRQDVYSEGEELSSLAYLYRGGVVHRQGLGFCGFTKISTQDLLRDKFVDSTYDPLQYGVPLSVESEEAKETYKYKISVASNKKLRIDRLEEVALNKLTSMRVSITYAYDEYGNCLSESQWYSGDSKYKNDLKISKKYKYINKIDPNNYVIGLPLSNTEGTFYNGSSYMKKDSVTYHDGTLLPYKNISYRNGLKVGENQKEYDQFGNVLSEKKALYESTNFLGDVYTYDTAHRYVASRTDALGRTTTYHTYNKWGKPASATDHLGKMTTYAYDGLGRLRTIIAPDGTTETVSYTWNPVKGLYGMLRSVSGQPDKMICYDALKREVRTGQQRFNGDWQYIDKEYDNYGRLYHESMPFKGTFATRWNTYGYDTHDRIISFTEASGKTTTNSYSANTITTTERGIAVTRTIDTNGQPIQIKGPSEFATYRYYADGQLYRIIAYGICVNYFEYDDYGRRTRMHDLSAGNILNSETNNMDGSRITTQTDANGLVTKVHYDAYGRVTLVERPEFNTSYTYDDVTKKLKSEISTNGTKKEYTYDTYGRLSTEKETVDDVWLQKSYTYTNGNVSKVSYSSSKDVSIVEENLFYANGTLNEVKLDSTSVWKLTAENELGQPTEAVTGGLTRTYGYTEYGLPNLRKSGSLQHFTYKFDVNTGNLLSRTDATRNLTENFTYDTLNRLTGYGTKTVTYADNGNILSKSDAGNLSYTYTGKPYSVTAANAQHINRSFQYNASGDRIAKNDSLLERVQTISYNSQMRPSTLSEGGNTAMFLYDASGNRKKMTVSQNGTVTQTKYYLGDQYETDDTKTLLYINGNAYSSPIVYVKESGQWKIYYICRDYLGSITHLVNADGTLAQELSYDAWGRLRNPQTQEVYDASAQPVLKLGRGYTGHEHLSLFGLVNMNARLYDPVLGRFLSPDPYVQMPDNLQNLNRYSYCLNNPLAYVDEDGEIWWFVVAAIVGAYIGGVSSNHGELNPVQWDYSSPSTYLSMGLGALCGYVGAYGIANPGTVGYLFGVSSSYVSVGIGVTAAGTSVGAIGSGTNWKFDLQWSTAAGGGGSFNIGTAHSGKDEGNTLRLDDGSEWDFSPYAYASAVSLGLLADDATLFGAVDDVLIPVAYGVATYSFVKNNSDLIAKEAREIAAIMKRNLSLKQGFVYELRAKTDGYYHNVRGGTTYLKEGDVWKIGQTVNGESRYTQNFYNKYNVTMKHVYYGNQMEILIKEKQMIYGYFFQHGTLPPGNRIFR